MLAAAPGNRTHSPAANRDDRPPPLADDAEGELAIVRRALHDPAAFAPLYERYVDAIFGFCYRRTSDRELAADLTHQLFARVLASLPGFDDRQEPGSFRSWLFSIARNLLIDTYRTRRETASLDQDAELRDHTRSPEDQAIASEQGRALADAMTHLTDGQRQVVELRLAGLTGPEIAATLGMQLPAVKSTQFRAYARLRDLLGDQLDEHPPTPTEGASRHA